MLIINHFLKYTQIAIYMVNWSAAKDKFDKVINYATEGYNNLLLRLENYESVYPNPEIKY